MKETTKTALRASAVLAVAFGLCVTGLTAADAKNPIKDAMAKYHKAPKGTEKTCEKAGKGTASKEELAGMIAAYKAMCAAKPTQGDQKKWVQLCTELVNATVALEKGEAGAADKYKKAVTCKTCHDEFRPAAKK
jgi:hypothetical protein